MPKRILITGAGGFIGGFLVEEALRRGYETWAGVRASTSRAYLTDERIHFVDLAFADKAKLKSQLTEGDTFGGGRRWDIIVHNLGVTKCRDSADFERINYGYVKNFSEALIETGTVPDQFILMSSLGAWGAGDERRYTPIRPDDEPHPDTLYGRSKLKAERFLQSLPDFPYVFMRPTGVYGPRERDYYLMMKSIKAGFDFSVLIRSIINTGVDVLPSDELLTLSTCTYEFKDARYVVVARKVRKGESADVDTSQASMNPNPLYPDVWYQLFGGTKPDEAQLKANLHS